MARRWNMPELMPPAAEIAAGLDPERWEVVRADDLTRLEAHGHHGDDDHGDHPTEVEVKDTLVHALRR